MSVSQYRFGGLTIERAQKIREATVAAIKAQQAGGMRSPDPAVRLATIAMPLTAETFEDRMRARRRLEPVLDDFERVRLETYRAARAHGLSEEKARAFAAEKAAPIKEQVDKIIAERRRATEAVVEKNRKRRLAAERDEAKKAGFR